MRAFDSPVGEEEERKIDWPGRMLEKFARGNPSGRVEDWLVYQGLEPTTPTTKD